MVCITPHDINNYIQDLHLCPYTSTQSSKIKLLLMHADYKLYKMYVSRINDPLFKVDGFELLSRKKVLIL